MLTRNQIVLLDGLVEMDINAEYKNVIVEKGRIRDLGFTLKKLNKMRDEFDCNRETMLKKGRMNDRKTKR